jgi:hypothetical protein
LNKKRTIFLDCVLIFALTAALIWPWFKVKFTGNWLSIESTFIADARFLRDHWPHPNWQPLWYGGTRFDFVYPPALRYGTAALAKAFPILPVKAYHIYTGFFYCVGIMGVYLFARTFGTARWWAWLTAAAAALISPAFLFLAEMRNDSLYLVPQRLGVLLRYGEGPHMTSFALIPLALAASYKAIEQWRPAMMAAAGLLCAGVVSHNFYGATSLAIWFPILLWSLWITYLDKWILLRAAVLVALAYGLTALWLTPSYIEVTFNNLKLVAQEGNQWSRWVALAVWMTYILATDKLARGRKERLYPVLVWGTFLFFTLNVLGHYYLDFRVTGEPMRMVPELDLAFILLGAELLRRLWERARWTKVAAAAGVVAALYPCARYLKYRHELVKWYAPYENRVEYRMQDWVAKNHPKSRVMATGSVRFWYNTWNDLAQMGGGSEQGLINHHINLAYVRVSIEDNVQRCVEWLQSYGVDMVLTHDQKSEEVYKDFVDPHKFARLMPVIFDNQRGDVVYGVPRRWPDLARVVGTARVKAIPPMDYTANGDVVRAYAEALEKGPDSPATLEWQGTDAMRVRATVRDGQSVLLQVTYDPAWHGYSGGQPLAVSRDAMGQMLVEMPPGDHDIRMVWELPRQNKLGRAVSLLCALAVLGLAAQGIRTREAAA